MERAIERQVRRAQTTGRASAAGQRGMTLIEIMVVVLIIGLISGAVIYAVWTQFSKAKVKTTKTKVAKVLQQVMLYKSDPDPNEPKTDSGCPESLALMHRHKLLKREQLRDAWGRKLKLQCELGRTCVYSTGPNERDENMGGDDIKACEGTSGEEAG